MCNTATVVIGSVPFVLICLATLYLGLNLYANFASGNTIGVGFNGEKMTTKMRVLLIMVLVCMVLMSVSYGYALYSGALCS